MQNKPHKNSNEPDFYEKELDSQPEPRKNLFKWWEIVLICILAIFIGLRLNSCEENAKESQTTTFTARGTITPTEPVLKSKYTIVQKSIERYDSYFYSNHMKAMVVVKNIGETNLYLNDADFDIEDSAGHLVASKNVSAYPQVIAPGEIGVYYYTFDLENVSFEEDFKLVPKLDIEQAKAPLSRFKVGDLSIYEDKYGYIKITGCITSTAKTKESSHKAVAIFYDKNGKVLGADYSYPDAIGPGETIGFEMTSSPLGFTLEDVAAYEVIVAPRRWQ